MKRNKKMEETKHKYVKQTQRDYSMPFKMAVAQEVERTGLEFVQSSKIWISLRELL